MPDNNRRLFLKLTASTPVLFACPGWLAADEETHHRILASMAYELFPYREIPSGVYHDIALAIHAQAQQSDETKEQVHAGLRRLDELAGDGGWTGNGRAQRQAVLKQMEGSPFFTLVYASAVRLLHRAPAVWEQVGYGGSSIEYGGYVNRGFNDIDWLPEQVH